MKQCVSSEAQVRPEFLPYALPSIGEEEIAEVVDTMRSGWVTTGPKVKRFESEFAVYIGARHAIAVNSCTAGLHVALAALDLGPGDEVIVPTLTFCATANVVVHLGAKPVLVDVGDDFNVRPESIEEAITPRTKALIPVHYGGQACDLKPLYALAAKYNLAVVEDAAHAVGSTYGTFRIGSSDLAGNFARSGRRGRATVFSFYATKTITTGEGGMITTDDEKFAERMRLLSLHGMSRDAWKRYSSSGSWFYEVVAAGYKDNMTDIQAALGIHQLRKIDSFIAIRQKYAAEFDRAFAELPEIRIPFKLAGRNHVYHLYAIRLNLKRLTIDRSQFIDELRQRNIGTSVHFTPVHLQPFYRDHFGYRQGDMPTAEAIYEGLVSLPLYPRMNMDDVVDVIRAVKEVVNKRRR